MADNKIIHSLLQEVRDDQKKAVERASEFREEVVLHHSETNHRLDTYNSQLEIHIQGVATLKGLHTDNVKRIEQLERPSLAMRFIGNKIVKIFGGITVILGTITGIVKLIALL
jgi:hypothetical protein